ncbi:MAG: hypothetical protein OEY97_12975 [Nitrospirota bacterium]|nr:hypothetical protein [Nitrospirota bacterium]
MLSTTEARTLVNDLFEQQALVVGGLLATHALDDDFVWRLMRSLDAIRTRTLRRLGDGPEAGGPEAGGPDSPEELTVHRHPAVEEFLSKLRRDRP